MIDGKVIIETERLILRELLPTDANAIAEIICDAETMRYFPSPFSQKDVNRWLERNFDRYRENGHGLWAVSLKSNGLLIGDCGLTWQDVDGVQELEVGYLISTKTSGAMDTPQRLPEHAWRVAFPAINHRAIISPSLRDKNEVKLH